MKFFDVNILLYAHREDTANHIFFKNWFLNLVNSSKPFAYSTIVLSSYIRIVTHPKIFKIPTPLPQAIENCHSITTLQNAIEIIPNEWQWKIFQELCTESKAQGNLVPDCFLASLAIEARCKFVTTDRDFKRFEGLDLEILIPKSKG